LRRQPKDPEKSKDPMSILEYFKSWQSLNVMDFFLLLFLILLILGFVLETNKEIYISVSIMGVLTFITLKIVNQRFARDICTTCLGQNKMSYANKLDVIVSFVWATVQTFLGLLMNAIYYFIVLYVIYILLRSHLLYSFADKGVDLRIMSNLHRLLTPNIKRAPSFIEGIMMLIYWSLLSVSCIIVITLSVLLFVKPDIFAQAFKFGFVLILAIPFIFTSITLIMKTISSMYLFDNLDKIIAHNVVPLLQPLTLLKGFNFFDQDILRAHIIVFINGIVNAILYAGIFLPPLQISCDGNNNEEFDNFKNRFLIGHYIIGLLMVLTYTYIIGGDIGQQIVKYTLALCVLVYFIVYLTMKHDHEN
jgi:hypothetical protein